MTILEKIKFEEDWLSEVNLTKENIKIAFAGIRATALEQQPCDDCISKKDAIRIASVNSIPVNECVRLIKELPPVTPKALEQTDGDCISRKAVLKHLENITMDTNPDHYGSKDKWYQANGFNMCKVGIEMYVKNLPSATPKTGWIPVSERESKYPCLACDKYGQIFIPIGVVAIDGHSYDGLHFEFDAEKFLKGHPREIMAWMPLPQPYKAESEE